MKKRMTSLLLALLMVLTLLPATAWADDAVTSGSCGTNVTWELTNGVLTISGDGAMEDYTYDSPAPWNAMKDSIMAVDVQDGVTRVSNYAFCDFENATSVKLGPSVKEIGEAAFMKCGMSEVVFPSGLTRIGVWAFLDCDSLLEVDIPASVTGIGERAFASCDKLKKVTTHPNERFGFGYFAFEDCVALEEVTLGEGLSYISSYVFRNCKSLKEIIIPDSVRKVETGAFYGCESLTRAHIGKAVEYLGYMDSDDFFEWSRASFEGCANLTTITVDSENPYFISINNVIFSKDMKKLIRYTPTKKGDYIIPDTVDFIKCGAFDSCSGLTSLVIPEGITLLQYGTVYGCASLKTVYWPKSLKREDGYNFLNTDQEKSPLTDIYYAGTEEEWVSCKFFDYATYWKNVTVHYECEMPVAVTPGDLNNDGTLDIQDMQTIYEYLTGQSELTKNQLKAADFNQDGVVDVYDLQALYEYVAYHSN